jgi:hypothetical protein
LVNSGRNVLASLAQPSKTETGAIIKTIFTFPILILAPIEAMDIKVLPENNSSE